jgi:hypothetical protein
LCFKIDEKLEPFECVRCLSIAEMGNLSIAEMGNLSIAEMKFFSEWDFQNF